ncbi:MAG: prenyltransferase/squalene oxidase repeat-containing protein [Planctomycetota bacterium]
MRSIRRAWLLLLLGAAGARAQDLTIPDRSLETRRQLAIRAGLDYLAQAQRMDGSWGDPQRGVVGITALGLLAFMAQGHQEGRGRYAQGEDVVRKGVDFLLRHSLPPRRKNPEISANGKPSGYIYVPLDRDSRMHGHGYATQVLVLAYGSGQATKERSQELRTKIQRAVRVIENAQTITGGWGYEPRHATPHEGSVTVTVVQALRLASDAGYVVDKETHRRGLIYLRDSQKRDGSFKYSHMADHSSAALTAAALTAMHGFGEYYSQAVRKGLRYLEDSYRNPQRLQWPFYAHYYAAQVFWRAGAPSWQRWQRRGMRHVLGLQEPGGFWDDRIHRDSRRGQHGRAYATAFSVLALSVSDGYLPLFQR